MEMDQPQTRASLRFVLRGNEVRKVLINHFLRANNAY